MPGTSGDYGLPAASRYGPAGPARPTVGPDTGLGNTTDESTTPTTVTEELVTPFVPEKTLEPVIHTPSGETVSHVLAIQHRPSPGMYVDEAGRQLPPNFG